MQPAPAVRPSIHFRYDIRSSSREQRGKILELYSVKFNRLIRECDAAILSAADYDDLPAMRRVLERCPQLHQLPIAALHALSERRVKLLMDAAPMFNACATNYKAYVLLSLGVRSSHISGNIT